MDSCDGHSDAGCARSAGTEPDARCGRRGPGLRSDVVVSWNNLAHDIAVAEDQFLTFKGQRALAMMHLAMHDALNAIAPVYERYAYTRSHSCRASDRRGGTSRT